MDWLASKTGKKAGRDGNAEKRRGCRLVGGQKINETAMVWAERTGVNEVKLLLQTLKKNTPNWIGRYFL